MIFLFRSGTPSEKISLILRATRTHAQNLAKYATVYKLTMLMLKHMGNSPGKEGPYDTFFAGLLGGYLVFGRRSKRGHISSVSKQIVIFGMLLLNHLLAFYCWFYEENANWNSVCESDALPSQIINSASGRHNPQSRTHETDIARCMAGLCGDELG